MNTNSVFVGVFSSSSGLQSRSTHTQHYWPYTSKDTSCFKCVSRSISKLFLRKQVSGGVATIKNSDLPTAAA